MISVSERYAEMAKMQQKSIKKRQFQTQIHTISKQIKTMFDDFKLFYRNSTKTMNDIQAQIVRLYYNFNEKRNTFTENPIDAITYKQEHIHSYMHGRIKELEKIYIENDKLLYTLADEFAKILSYFNDKVASEIKTIGNDFQELYNKIDFSKKHINFIKNAQKFIKKFESDITTAKSHMNYIVNRYYSKFLQFEKKYFDIVRIYNLYQREKRNYEKQNWYNYQIKKHRWEPYEKIKHQNDRAMKQCLPKLNIQKATKGVQNHTDIL